MSRSNALLDVTSYAFTGDPGDHRYDNCKDGGRHQAEGHSMPWCLPQPWNRKPRRNTNPLSHDSARIVATI
jgi:hypothetical protein